MKHSENVSLRAYTVNIEFLLLTFLWAQANKFENH